MPAKIISAPPVQFSGRPLLARHLEAAFRRLLGGLNRAGNSAERALVLEDRIAIGPKKSLSVVRCHGQRFLIATAGDTIGPLLKLAPPKTSPRPRRGRPA